MNLIQMTIIFTTVGKNLLEEMGVAIIVNKRVWNAVLGCNLKNDRMISVHFQGNTFHVTVIQVYALTGNAEEAEVEWPTRPSRINTQKRCEHTYSGKKRSLI